LASKPPRIEICAVFRAASLPDHVEGVAGIEADGLVLSVVINVVLAGEFELTIIVAPIESHAFFWKRHDKMIRGLFLNSCMAQTLGNKWGPGWT